MLLLAVAFFCLVPLGDIHPPRVPYFDKIIHVFLFGLLTFVWSRGLTKYGQQNALMISVVCCIAYGFVIEILQEVMQLGRAFEWLDIGADTLGVLLASSLFLLLKRS